MIGIMTSSDGTQNEKDGARFQSRVGNRSEYYADQVRKSEQLREIYEAHDRARFWFAVRVVLACFLSTGFGLFIMAWALHTTDMESARVAWVAGPVIGNGLTLIVIGWAAVKWERDEW